MSDFAMSGDDLEQMYQEVILEASKNPHGKEHFAPDLASENASQAGKTTVQATHEYCTPGESHQSIRPAETRPPCMWRFPTRSRTLSNDWCGTVTAAPFHRPAFR